MSFGAVAKIGQQRTGVLINTKLEEVAGLIITASVQSDFADFKRNFRVDTKKPDAKLRVYIISASFQELCKKRDSNFVEKVQKVTIQNV